MIAIFFVALGILLPIISLAFKQRTTAIVTLSLVGLGLSLLALILFFVKKKWGEDDVTLGFVWPILGLVGFICGVIAFRKKTAGESTREVGKR